MPGEQCGDGGSLVLGQWRPFLHGRGHPGHEYRVPQHRPQCCCLRVVTGARSGHRGEPGAAVRVVLGLLDGRVSPPFRGSLPLVRM